jgi:hypothetical protein
MLMKVNLTFKSTMALLAICFAVTFGYSGTTLEPNTPPHTVNTVNAADPAHYKFSTSSLDQMLQMIETYRNLKPFHATLDYGVKFYPEMNLETGKLNMVAKACIIFPYDAIPLNLPGNSFKGDLVGDDFFDAGFIKTFQKNPADANGAVQAYTFAVVYENQVQILLSGRGVVGLKLYNVNIDYLSTVPKSTTTKFYNLNVVSDIPNTGFGAGAPSQLAIPCPPFWRE